MEPFEAVALDLGFLTLRQIRDAFDLQMGETNINGASGHQMGELFVALGYLTVEQVDEVIAHRKFRDLTLTIELHFAA